MDQNGIAGVKQRPVENGTACRYYPAALLSMRRQDEYPAVVKISIGKNSGLIGRTVADWCLAKGLRCWCSSTPNVPSSAERKFMRNWLVAMVHLIPATSQNPMRPGKRILSGMPCEMRK